jgi:hypothetical protein
VAARIQQAGLLILAVGVGLLASYILAPTAGVGCALIVSGVGVLAFGVAAEREVTDGSSTPASRTH